MTAIKTALVKVALIGTLAGGALGMPLVASASTTNDCRGLLVSTFVTQTGGLGETLGGETVQTAQQTVPASICNGGDAGSFEDFIDGGDSGDVEAPRR